MEILAITVAAILTFAFTCAACVIVSRCFHIVTTSSKRAPTANGLIQCVQARAIERPRQERINAQVQVRTVRSQLPQTSSLHSTQQRQEFQPPPRLRTTATRQSSSIEPSSSSLNLEDLQSFPLTGKHGEEVCPVCFDKLKEQMVSVGQCLHFVHTSCLKKWLSRDKSKACPVCRAGYDI